MKITSIPQIYRNLNRSIEVLSVLSKYGLAGWVAKLDLEFAKEFLKSRAGESLARQSAETRIRLALTELGPTFIKLGQVLSTRADLVGLPLAEELQQLQEDTPADPPEVVRTMIERELGEPLEELFATFCDKPLASASIGQVHAATLKTGEAVVVKVRHAGIEEKVRVDLDILSGLAQLAERVPEFKNYRPQATAAEFQRTLLRELDFSREERNIQQFAQDLRHNSCVHIPQVYPELSTGRVLTMERLEGIKLSETARLTEAGADLAEVSRRGAELYMEMIFSSGYYHADPHPGNLVVMPGNVIGLLDFGMVGRIDEPLREDIEEMLLAIGNRDAVHLTSIITRLGAVPADLDQASLSLDVTDFVSHYTTQRLDEFNLSGALKEMIDLIRRYQIMLPARVAMLIKVLVMLEGTSRLVSPRFSLIEVMGPYQRKMVSAAAFARAAGAEDAAALLGAGAAGSGSAARPDRHSAAGADRPVRYSPGPSRAGAERQPAGVGADHQRAVPGLRAAAQPESAAADQYSLDRQGPLRAGPVGLLDQRRAGPAAAVGHQQVRALGSAEVRPATDGFADGGSG